MKKCLTSVPAIAIAAGVLAPAVSAQESITVVSWGGAYTAAQRETLYEPFTKATGITVNSVDYNGGLGQVKAQVQAQNVSWDVVVGEMSLAEIGCFDDILEKQNLSSLPAAPDGTPAREDFIEGTLGDCGVGHVVLATTVVYNTTKFPNGGPTTIADFFDLEKFPGKRSLRRSADISLEWALLADGVPAADIYKVLATPEGVARAFAKLDTIKSSVVWWESASQPPQLLADGEVVMASAYSARSFHAINEENQPFNIVWDGQIWDRDVWMIPKGTSKREAAEKFVNFASQTLQQAAMTNVSSYGPVRKSAIALIGEHPRTGVDMRAFVPTAHFENAIESDTEFWSTYRDELFARFNAWLAR